MFSLLHLTQAVSIASLAAFLLCLLTLRPLIQLGIMDTPVQRSAHHTPIAKGGGLAIIVAFLGSMALHASITQHPLTRSQLCLAGGVFFLCAVSWVDDIRPFPARYKLLAQTTATAILLIGYHPTLATIAPILFMGLVCTNTINFMDGLNGLASGTMLLSAVIMAGYSITPVPLLLLASSLLGFLPFNFPKARIFMGDAGSQPCALIFVWAWLSLAPTTGNFSDLKPLFWLPACLMTSFLWDVAFTLGRRLCAGDSLATAHHGHLYQLAARTHIPAPYITLYHWGCALWGGVAFSELSGINCVAAILMPQVLWTISILKKARTHLKEKW